MADGLLFTPLRVGSRLLRNRVVMTPHGMRMVRDGLPSDQFRAYIAERARGGVALIALEFGAVSPETALYDRQLQLWRPEIADAYRPLAAEVHAAGAVVVQQLWHGGHNVPPWRTDLPALAPSPIPDARGGPVPRAMDLQDIRRVIAAYATAAGHAVAGGLDGVEVQTSADYLLGSFLSPALNQRTDAYGGSTGNRVRIVVEILQAIRERVGAEVLVGVRTSGDHGMAGGVDTAVARDAVAAVVATGLVDYVSVMAGSFYDPSAMIPPTVRHGMNAVPLAAQLREVCTVPLVVTGRIRRPEDAEALLADGVADLVGMARTLIADPRWPAKAAAGRAERIRPCISCNQGCFGMVAKGRSGTCVVNPVAGLEHELPSPPPPAAAARRVLVVGGGPAGMEAARVAAGRGHRVELRERGDRLGGALRLAAEVPGLEDIAGYLAWAEAELTRAGVAVRLGDEVRAETVGPEWDAVLVATGARPTQAGFRRFDPRWPGLAVTGARLRSHVEALQAADLGRRVLVVDEDPGHTSAAVVLGLAQRGLDVQVVTSAATFGGAELQQTLTYPALVPQLLALGVRFRCGALLLAVADGAATVRDLLTGATETVGPFDEVVLCTGTEPDGGPADALRARGVDVVRIGDCLSARGLQYATYDGQRAGRAV